MNAKVVVARRSKRMGEIVDSIAFVVRRAATRKKPGRPRTYAPTESRLSIGRKRDDAGAWPKYAGRTGMCPTGSAPCAGRFGGAGVLNRSLAVDVYLCMLQTDMQRGPEGLMRMRNRSCRATYFQGGLLLVVSRQV